MASPELEALLVLQGRDTILDQLSHRRAHLAERASVAELTGQIKQASAQLAEAELQQGELNTRQAAVEAELKAAETRLAELDSRFYSGTVTASRDLMAITEEIDSLKKRRSILEDRVLEVMTEREPVDSQVDQTRAAIEQITAAFESAKSALLASEAEIDGEVSHVATARREAEAAVPADLVFRYEKLRSHLGGVGAARMNGPSCGGCHLTLPSTEVERIRKAPAGELITCEQCGRILVP